MIDREMIEMLEAIEALRIESGAELTRDEKYKLHIMMLIANGAVVCYWCGMPSGLKTLTIRKVKIKDKDYNICNYCLEKQGGKNAAA